MPEKIFVKNLIADTFVDSPFLLRNIQVRQKKNGDNYLSMTLADKTGEVGAVMWDGVSETKDKITSGDIVQVTGKVSKYNERMQMTVQRAVKLDKSDIDAGDYMPSTDNDIGVLWTEINEIVNSMGHLHLRRLIMDIFNEEGFFEKFTAAPAAKGFHHTYLGGLLEHTLSIVKMCEKVADHYPMLDRDLLITGGILHDMAKIDELKYDQNFDYTDEGRLLGHIVMGTIDLDRRMRDQEFPEMLRIKVLHMIISHHGEEQFGSPKKPMIPEAFALHFIDLLDSRMEMVRFALENDADSEGAFTQYVRGLESFIFKG